MKKLIIILFSVLIIFTLSSCDVLELSAPEAKTTGEETSTEPKETTKGEETSTEPEETTKGEEGSTDLTKFEYSGEMVIEPIISSNIEVTTESQLILDLLNNGKWIDDLGECINDYTISLNGKVIRYSSYCGTFNNITDGTSLNISDDEKASVNEYLESLFEGIDPSWE